MNRNVLTEGSRIRCKDAAGLLVSFSKSLVPWLHNNLSGVA